jgi:hypothetical protein
MPAESKTRALEAVTEEAAARASVRTLVAAAEHRLVLATSGEQVMAWPRAYLDPACRFSPAPPDIAPRVAVVVAGDLHAEARAALAATGEGVPASTYEDKPARRHDLGRAGFALAYEEEAGITFVDPRARVLFLTSDPGQAPFEAARLIREVLRRDAEAAGDVVVHAGGVVLGGGAWVIPGPKEAGKTTLTCALVEYGGGEFVANDRVLVGTREGAFDVRAWPMSTRIGVGTCLASPGLRRWLRPVRAPAYPQTGWDPARGISDAEARTLAEAGAGPKIELVTAELVDALGARASAGAPLAGVLLPARRPGAVRATVTPVDPNAAALRIGAELLTPDDEAYPDWLELRRSSVDEMREHAAGIVRRIAAEVPVCEVVFEAGADAAAAVATAKRTVK